MTGILFLILLAFLSSAGWPGLIVGGLVGLAFALSVTSGPRE